MCLCLPFFVRYIHTFLNPFTLITLFNLLQSKAKRLKDISLYSTMIPDNGDAASNKKITNTQRESGVNTDVPLR